MNPNYLFFFLGVDPAPSDSQRSDDGAVVVGCAQPRGEPDSKGEIILSDNEADWFFDFVYARVFTHKEKLSARQWSGFIHLLHERFGLEKILMDAGAGGGGVLVKRELMAPNQMINGVETRRTPIADQVDGPKRLAHAHFMLHMFKRGDPGVDAAFPSHVESKSLAGDELLKDALYSTFKEDLDGGLPGFPAPVEEWYGERRQEIERWPEERLWALKNLDAATKQFMNIMVATSEDGTHVFTKRGAHIFNSVGRDDIALASMLSRAAFRIWLRGASFLNGRSKEDDVAYSGW